MCSHKSNKKTYQSWKYEKCKEILQGTVKEILMDLLGKSFSFVNSAKKY